MIENTLNYSKDREAGPDFRETAVTKYLQKDLQFRISFRSATELSSTGADSIRKQHRYGLLIELAHSAIDLETL